VTAWNAEELRRAVLDALGPHVDERAREALRLGRFALAPEVAQWESSGGTTAGHRVVIALDAARLGALRASHASVDAIGSAVAAAVATRPGQTMLELSLEWAPEGLVAAAGYRDTPVPPASLKEALVAYLDASGEPGLAAALAGAMVTRRASDAHVVFAPEPRAHVRAHRHGQAALTRALRDLLGDAHLRVTVDG
jgi:hypothetical protein